MNQGGNVEFGKNVNASGALDPAAILEAVKVNYAIDVTDTRGATKVNFWGDSLGVSAGGTQTKNYPGGTPVADYVKNASGFDVLNYSISGETTGMIKARFLAAPERRKFGHIFSMGTNNSGNPNQVKADILECVAAVGHSRFLIVGLPGHSSSSYWQGTPSYDNIIMLNNWMAATFGERFCNVRAALVAAYNPGIPQDVIDFSHDIPPTSLMAPADIVHYNDAGYKVWGATIAPKMYLLKMPATEEKILTTASLFEMFSNAPPVTTKQVVAQRIAVNFATLSNSVFPDIANANDPAMLEVNGAAVFWHQEAVPGKEGGIFIKQYSKDTGGRANMAILGTSAVWTLTPNKGFIFRNDIAQVDIGCNLNIAGDLVACGNITTADKQIIAANFVNANASARLSLGTNTASLVLASSREFRFDLDGVYNRLFATQPFEYQSNVATGFMHFFNGATGSSFGGTAIVKIGWNAGAYMTAAQSMLQLAGNNGVTYAQFFASGIVRFNYYAGTGDRYAGFDSQGNLIVMAGGAA